MSRYVVVNRGERALKRRRLLKKAVAIFCVLLVAAAALSVWFYWRSMTPTILDIALVQVQSQTAQAVNEALSAVLGGVDYRQLITVEKNSQNDVVLLTANSNAINTLARSAALTTQGKINGLFADSIKIPLGTLSGIPLLNELGPHLKIEVSPVGTVSCAFTSEFETAGINQTLHRIYLTVQSTVDVIIPSSHQIVETETPVLVCETVIVGKVPDTFLQGGFLLGSSSV